MQSISFCTGKGKGQIRELMGKRGGGGGAMLNRIQNSAGFGFNRNGFFFWFFCFVFISTSNGSIHLPA